MAARSKAATKAAESKTPAKSVEQASKELNDLLKANEPDAEKPVPTAPTNGEGEKAKKVLALNEIEGEIKDGEKIKIGVQMWGGANAGAVVNKTLVVPTDYFLAKAVKGVQVHVIDKAKPDRTICLLPTDWESGTM